MMIDIKTCNRCNHKCDDIENGLCCQCKEDYLACDLCIENGANNNWNDKK